MNTGATPEQRDVLALTALVKRLDGRIARRIRRQPQPKSFVMRRDPIRVIARYLRRFHGDGRPWYRGGSHVARHHHGPGIAIPAWRNDRAMKLRPQLINATP